MCRLYWNQNFHVLQSLHSRIISITSHTYSQFHIFIPLSNDNAEEETRELLGPRRRLVDFDRPNSTSVPHFPSSAPAFPPTPAHLGDSPHAFFAFYPTGHDPCNVFDPANRPPVPPLYVYNTPRGRLYHPGIYPWGTQVTREDRLVRLFRRTGFYRLSIQYERQNDQVRLAFLRGWLVMNQHVPVVYVLLGTDMFEPEEPDGDDSDSDSTSSWHAGWEDEAI